MNQHNQKRFTRTICNNNNNDDSENNDNNMGGGKDENGKLNDLEYIPDK